MFTANLSITTARELAIDAVLERMSEAELKDGSTVIRDAELSERAVILTEVSLYVIHAHARTRSANITATYFGNTDYGHDVITF